MSSNVGKKCFKLWCVLCAVQAKVLERNRFDEMPSLFPRDFSLFFVLYFPLSSHSIDTDIKGKIFPVQATKTYRGSRDMSPLILNFEGE
jgi:hypothetical protein